MRFWSCAAVLLLLAGCSSGPSSPIGDDTADSGYTPDPWIGKGRIEKVVPGASYDVGGLRKVADAELANHPAGFKLFAIYVRPDTNDWSDSDKKLPLSGVHFYYSRAVRGGWEALDIDFPPPRYTSIESYTIGMTADFREARKGPQPNPAPVNMPATEDAVLRLFRSYPRKISGGKYSRAYSFVAPGYVDPKIWLTEGGAARLGRELSTEEHEQDFFAATAPRGRWVWWTEKHFSPSDGPDTWEFIYIDAVTGTTTSHCAAEVAKFQALHEIPCSYERPERLAH